MSVGYYVTDVNLRRKYRPKLPRILREIQRHRSAVDGAATFLTIDREHFLGINPNFMEKIPYLRVCTACYKSVHVPTIARRFNEILVHWNIETIRRDHGKDYLAKVPKYEGFTCIPGHIQNWQVYKGLYNTYFPLTVEPKEGKIDNSSTVIRCRGKDKGTLMKTS